VGISVSTGFIRNTANHHRKINKKIGEKMKKMTLLFLGVLVGAVKPALAMDKKTNEKWEMHDYGDPETEANWTGLITGGTTGLAVGLGSTGILHGTKGHNTTPALVGLACCNLSSHIVNRCCQHMYRKKVQALLLKDQDKKKLKKSMENYAFWTDAVVTTGLISGLASGPVKSLWSGAPENNSWHNFCVTLPFVFAGVTALKYGSYKLHKWMYGKPKAE
jgi:hypothetical protein